MYINFTACDSCGAFKEWELGIVKSNGEIFTNKTIPDWVMIDELDSRDNTMNSLANNVTNSFEIVVYNNHTSFIQASHTMCKSIRCNLRWGVYTLKTPAGSNLIRKGSLGAKLHSGSTMTRKSVNLTRNMTQRWVTLTPFYVRSAKSWQNSGSLLTRNWVIPPTDPFPGNADPGVFRV